MKEFEKGKFKNRKQALAVSYSQIKRKYPIFGNFLDSCFIVSQTKSYLITLAQIRFLKNLFLLKKFFLFLILAC